MLSVGSLFAGIGGIDLGLERTGGFRTEWFSEIDPFANAVLRKHWPSVPNLGDVTLLDGDSIPGVDVLAGGFPCQPVSLAGKRLAQDDPRWLWPHVARLVGHLRPRYVLLENVPGLRSKGLGDVLQDLSALGYDAEWEGISAAAVGAPHRRDRIWVIAYPRRTWDVADARGFGGPTRGNHGVLADPTGAAESHCEQWKRGRNASNHCGEVVAHAGGEGRGQVPRVLADSHDAGREEQRLVFTAAAELTTAKRKSGWLPEPAVGRVADGVPNRVAQLRALGNAVVPQVAEVVGHLILADASRARASHF